MCVACVSMCECAHVLCGAGDKKWVYKGVLLCQGEWGNVEGEVFG